MNQELIYIYLIITTTATASNPNLNAKTTWKEVFASGDDVVDLNKIHPQVVKILHATSENELTASVQKETIGNSTALKLNSIMFLSTFREMTILHHNTKIRGGLLCPQAEHFKILSDRSCWL